LDVIDAAVSAASSSSSLVVTPLNTPMHTFCAIIVCATSERAIDRQYANVHILFRAFARSRARARRVDYQRWAPNRLVRPRLQKFKNDELSIGDLPRARARRRRARANGGAK